MSQTTGNGQLPDTAWFCRTADANVDAPEITGNSAADREPKRRHRLCWRHAMSDSELCFTPATELVDAIRAKKVSAVEISKAC
jgi:hypothetical protein